MPAPFHSLRPWPRFFVLWTSLLMLVLLAAGPGSLRATSVGGAPEKCPLCGNEFVVTVLLSYTRFSRDDAPPTMPAAVCPRCLFAWQGRNPGTLNAEEAGRVRAAIASWPESLPPAARQRLREDLDRRSGFDNEPRGITDDLAARCRAALAGDPPPPSTVPATLESLRHDPTTLLEDATFVRMLPELVAAQRRGEPALAPVEHPKADPTLRNLQSAATAINAGNEQALEFFLRWAVGPSAKTFRRDELDWALTDSLFAMAAHRDLPWPADLDLDQASLPFVADCLRYVRFPETALPPSLKAALAAKADDSFKEIALAACAARRDRAAAKSAAKTLAATAYVGRALQAYYEMAGVTEDLGLLGAKARRKSKKVLGANDNSVNFLSARNCEDVIRHLQFKRLFSGESPADY